ncbi:hypothetical protein ACFE04_026122 [Oxalis oulophora]
MDVQDKNRTGEQVPNDDGMSAPQNVPAVDGPPINMRPWIFHVRAFMIEYLFARLIQRTPHPDDEAKRTYLKGRAKHLDDAGGVYECRKLSDSLGCFCITPHEIPATTF